jgi:hypothetical protein
MAYRGAHLIVPTSATATGTGSSATISANGSVEFSACATLSLNGVFSADYDNYTVVMRHVAAAGDPVIAIRLVVGGVEASGANYTRQKLEAASTAVAGSRGSNTTDWPVANTSATQRTGYMAYFYGPFLAQPTALRTISAWGRDSARIDDYAATHSLPTSYDGFKMTLDSSSFTGRIAVYGMRK